MQRIILRLNAKVRCQIKNYPQDTFGKAMKYVDEHFTEVLSLESASEALFLNKNYLSDLFSKRLVDIPLTQDTSTAQVEQFRRRD